MKRIAIITGGSGSLGLELIKRYLDNNYIVYAIHNSNKINIENDNLFKYKYDLENEKEFTILIKDLKKKITDKSQISFIHASGIYSKSNIEDFDYEEFNKFINVNTISFLCLYSKLFNVIKKASLCNIVLISSNLTKRLNKGSMYYVLSKSMNNQIVKQIAYEHGSHNILANAIAPGMFISNMNKDYDKDKLKIIENNIPIKKLLTATDLANYIVNFTENNLYITGEIITIDGGNTLGY